MLVNHLMVLNPEKNNDFILYEAHIFLIPQIRDAFQYSKRNTIMIINVFTHYSKKAKIHIHSSTLVNNLKTYKIFP